MRNHQPTALISVTDKAGIGTLGHGLLSRGFQIISTGGTLKALKDEGVTAIPIEAITGVPEALHGRVKTLNHKIFGGILARQRFGNDLEELESVLRARPIDVVVVNLYPFAETAAKPGVAAEELIENIDIGGPSLIRAAAKNYDSVLVLVDPADYVRALNWIANDVYWHNGARAFRLAMCQKAFRYTAAYDAVIARELLRVRINNNSFSELEPAAG